jgi:hypothetical protein
MDDVDRPEGGQEPQPEGGGNDEQQLIAGKFKTQDDLVSSYKEAERKIHESTTRASQLEAENERLKAEREQYYTQPVVQSQGNDYLQQLNDQFIENPAQAAVQVNQMLIAQMRQVEKNARANMKREIAARKSDPLFREVQDEYEAILETVDDAVLANPQQAAAICEQAYNAVVGQWSRKKASSAKDDPKARKEIIDKIGLGAPEGSRDSDVDISLDERTKDMFDAWGIKGKSRDEVVSRAIARRDER